MFKYINKYIYIFKYQFMYSTQISFMIFSNLQFGHLFTSALDCTYVGHGLPQRLISRSNELFKRCPETRRHLTTGWMKSA